MEQAELQELERIKEQLRRHPRHPLQEFETQIILRHLEADKIKGHVGAPALLAEPHRFIAIHYWWLRENGMGRHAAKKVATRWGISVKAVSKYANEHKGSALKYVRERQAKAKANAALYPDWAFEQMVDLIAEGFRKLDE